jgi:rhamnogalacturonan endolyase
MRLILLLLSTLALAPASPVELFRDDFSKFPPGWLSKPVGLLNGAIQEYHYLPHRGVPTHPWYNPITHNDSWVAGDEDGKTYLEQHLLHDQPERWQPLFVTGDPLWSSYTVSARVRPLSLSESAGIVFRYHTNRHYYVFSITGGKRARLALRLPVEQKIRVVDWKELGSADISYDVKQYHELKVENDGPKMRAYFDGKLVIEASDSDTLNGRAGITANIPARFTDFVVSAPEAIAQQIRSRVAAREKELAALRAANPQPKLWKKFSTPQWGAGRNVRFGDLDGDGRLDMLIAQNIPKVRGDAFDHISCLTAVTLDGKLLWQLGRPDPRNTLLTNDTPFQIHDFDGDGKNEVVMVKDFQIQVLEGATGKVRQRAQGAWREWMPPAPAANKDRPYELNSGDSMIFLNLSGKKGRQELLLKDRYNTFWVFDNNLKQLWSGTGQTGHYPYPYDFNSDGKDEFVIGFALWNAAGKYAWSHDAQMKDHADAISIGNYTGDAQARPRVYVCGSDEGLVVFSEDGKIVKQMRVGHTQTQSVGKYRPEITGLQILTATFWRNTGIVTLFDPDANILAQEELIPGSSHLQTVNWRGDGQEFALLNANVREGGMIDGQLRRVVMLPDDGHPDLAYQVLNVTGDERDELIVWDAESVWIYTQDRPFTGQRMYKPTRNPLYNDSNYRATVSLPGWKQ